jgi:hypothetical protein
LRAISKKPTFFAHRQQFYILHQEKSKEKMGLQEPYDWIIRFSAEIVLIFTFMLLLLPALWKLAMSRPGLIIVFSRVSSNKHNVGLLTRK